MNAANGNGNAGNGANAPLRDDVMSLRVLGNMGGSCENAYSTAALIDDNTLLDAGTGAQKLSLEQMRNISNVLLTHSHLDHTAMLFFLIDCRMGGTKDGVRVHCLKETADAIRRGVLNNETWPDLEDLHIDGKPVMEFCYLEPYKTINVGGRQITPLPVVHAVPTLGYCLHGRYEDFVYVADIYDAEPAFWEYLNNLKRLRRMVMEVSFPDEMETLAHASHHLTPSLLEARIKNLPDEVEVFYCHTKPQVRREVSAQISKRFGQRVRELRQEEVFTL